MTSLRLASRSLAPGLMSSLCACLLALTACSSDSSTGDTDLPDGSEGLDPIGTDVVGGKADGNGADWPSNGDLPTACNLDDPPIQVFFAPDDPTTTLELDLIDQVREARKASSESYAEGENPFRIRYAVYNLTHQDIAQKLADAENDGVDVQVLVESDQLNNEWVEVDDIFENAGLEVVRDDRSLNDASRTTADLIGIVDPGLMHLKTRLFEAPGWSAVLTGSLNPNGSAGVNEENINLIRDPATIGRYAEGYEAVLHRKPLRNIWDDNAPINVMFSPVGEGQRASTKMLQWLEQEKEQILIMVFSLRDVSSPEWDRSLVEILRDKAAQGIPVAVITDRKQSDGVDLDGNAVYRDDWTEDQIRSAGIPVYEAINDASAYFGSPYAYSAMHHKVAILGRTNVRVITDASNWTAAALGSKKYKERNVETMMFVDSARLDNNAIGHRYMAQWMRVLDRYAYQSVEVDDQPTAAETKAWLFGMNGWPTQPVTFRVEAETSYGENIVVAGDHDALGQWGELHPGVALTTEADTYPMWHEVNAANLPLGTSFLWKLTARSSQNTRWENGPNRDGFAIPRICSSPDEDARYEARWR